MAMQGGPDEDSMMNLAIALSLHDEVNKKFNRSLRCTCVCYGLI